MKTLLTAGVAMWVIGSTAVRTASTPARWKARPPRRASSRPPSPPSPPEPVIQKLMSMLTGSFKAPAAGNRPALRFNSAAITVDGEFDKRGVLRDRSGGFARQPLPPGRAARLPHEGPVASAGLRLPGGGRPGETRWWACGPRRLIARLEAREPGPEPGHGADPGEKTGTYSGATPHPYPTCREGAVELTQSCSITDNKIGFADMGMAADGQTVWGGSVSQTMFKRATPTVTAKRIEGGLIVLTLVAPATDAMKLGENGEIAVQYSGWLTDGTRFDSSRQPGRDALRAPHAGPGDQGLERRAQVDGQGQTPAAGDSRRAGLWRARRPRRDSAERDADL